MADGGRQTRVSREDYWFGLEMNGIERMYGAMYNYHSIEIQ